MSELSCGYRLVSLAEQRTSVWSGGSTTELAIYPPGACYASRDFQWRLSSAVVTADESVFTALPGYQRLLLVLDGQMQLSHEGHHQVLLQPFTRDVFSGSWVTHCRGTGRDFNLMLASGWRGDLRVERLLDQTPLNIGGHHPGETEALYCLSGDAHLELPSGTGLKLRAGDLLLLQPQPYWTGRGGIEVWGTGTLICASIWPESD